MSSRLSAIRNRASRGMRAALARVPELYMVVQRLRHRRTGRITLVDKHTDLLIEGFPRSGNGWCIRVFDHWQGGTARIARHEHSEAHVVAAIRRGVPVLVLVRDPADAIRSFLQRDPDLDPAWALRRWSSFYRVVERHAANVAIATFGQVTGDFGTVVQRINARFDVDFRHGPTDEALFRKVTSEMASSSWPDPDRRRRLAAIPLEFDADELAAARAMYARLAALAGA